MWLADLGTLLARIRFLSLWKAERVPKVPLEMSLSSTLSRVIRVHSKLNSLWAGVFKLMNLTHHWPYWEVQIWGKKLRAGDVTASPWSEKKAHLLYGTLRQRCSVFLPWWSERVWGQEPAAILQSGAWLFGTPWTVAHQAPLSIGFSRQEHWNGWSFPYSGGSSPPRDGSRISRISCLGRRVLSHCAIWEALNIL